MKKSSLSRRDFLRICALAGLGSAAACAPARGELPATEAAKPTSFSPKPAAPAAGGTPKLVGNDEAPTSGSTPQSQQSGQAYLAVARGEDPEAITRAALAALGGMSRFVKSGADVIVKPNMCTDYYSYEYAATTNPQVVAALVRMCLEAGAKRVRVMDMPFGGSAESAYARSGIGEAAKSAGAQVEIMNRNKYRTTPIPDGKDLKECDFYADILAADLVINVPIAKNHELARLTLGGKNLLGTIAEPWLIHANMGQRVADLISRVRPALTVIDAVRILVNNGPTGGNLDDVKKTNTIIASHDIVAADSYATGLFGLQGSDISYIQAAADMGLGTMDWKSVKLEEVAL